MALKHGAVRPHITDYWTQDQIAEFFQSFHERAKTDTKIAIWCADQLSGKAVQAISGPNGGPIQITDVEIVVRPPVNEG
jgi:hypothetical protein